MKVALPIDALRAKVTQLSTSGPLVLTSPTGSGKSTRVPTFLAGRVIVIEPRRVACQSLARRVAEEEGVKLGGAVGYHVRDDRRESDDTRILFMTPGMALRRFDDVLDADALVLDELHERQLDVDLLLALSLSRYAGQLILMSATLDAERLAAHVGGQHLEAEGRTFPVEIDYRPDGGRRPTGERLADRVVGAIEATPNAGDTLVFLPGKAEIGAVAQRLVGVAGLAIVELHGGLPLKQQTRAFEPVAAGRRKIVLATNVAETSLTVPGIRLVIDSGLVRRTRYHRGRGYLALLPIARDAAEQRAGRAGRMEAGRCLRLWDRSADLELRTPPEIHRESLVPLVLSAAALRVPRDELRFFDEPKEHAWASASGELRALGAIDDAGEVTPQGESLFGLPIDAFLGRLLIAAKGTDLAADMLDLVAALQAGRIFRGAPPAGSDHLRAAGCDATALIGALRGYGGEDDHLDAKGLAEARRVRARLAPLVGVDPALEPAWPIDRARLARAILRAEPRAAHALRERKRHRVWAAGGAELEEGRDSAIAFAGKSTIAALVLDTYALGRGERGARLVATALMPVRPEWVIEAGAFEVRVDRVRAKKGRIIAEMSKVLAGQVLETFEAAPEGEAAREAARILFLRGSLGKPLLAEARRRLAALALAASLEGTSYARELGLDGSLPSAPPALDAFVDARLAELGVEHGDDLALLEDEDWLPDALPAHIVSVLDRSFPIEIDLGEVVYEARYNLAAKKVSLHIVRGARKKPPPRSFLPTFRGFAVWAEAGGTLHHIR